MRSQRVMMMFRVTIFLGLVISEPGLVVEMSGELAAAGALVILARNLIETIKSLGGVIRRSRRDEAQIKQFEQLLESVKKYNNRLSDLAVQLEQSERLTRMMPAWLQLASTMPFWQDPDRLEMSDIRKLDSDLRRFVHDSTRDHFSGTFFHTDFTALPGVESEIKVFRRFLTDFDNTLSAVPPGNAPAFKALWASLSTQFNSLTNRALEIERLAEDLQGSLVRELVQASKETAALQDQ